MSLKKAEPNETLLLTTLKFSADDLRINRGGITTSEQKDKLRRLRLEGSVLPLSFIFLTGAFVQETLQRNDHSNGVLLRFLVTSVLLFAAILFGVMRWLKITTDLRNGIVSVVTGAVVLGNNELRNVGYIGSGSGMRVEGVHFVIPFTARKPFLDGKRFRIYYAPTTKIILSAERHIH